MSHTFMESERLWYRAPERSDLSHFTRWLQDPRVTRNLLIGRYPFNEESEAEWFDRNGGGMPAMDTKTDVSLAFGFKGEEVPLGITGLHRISWLHRHAEWGVVIGRIEEWGKGYGREVGRTIQRYAFQTLNLNRVYLRVNADHLAGIRAYAAAGFVKEGVMREVTFVEGHYVDQVVMGKLRSEWKL